MEKSEIKYSLKNIPIPPKVSYLSNLIDKIESLVKRMRWRGFYYLNQRKCDNIIKETFNFKSSKCPPPCSDLVRSEKDLSDMITALKFRDVIKRRIRQLGKRHHQTRSFNEPFNFKRAYLSSLKFAIESNALYVNLLL